MEDTILKTGKVSKKTESNDKSSTIIRTLMKRRQGISLDEMGNHGKVLRSTAGRQNCAENGSEWVESDEIDSEDLMDVI